ncbi:MAG: hypothetical protein JXM72_05920, partial [Deltaproteobacteria bacterium]|nr:hypothetical protein [Deltaproteobacteria bacterium]
MKISGLSIYRLMILFVLAAATIVGGCTKILDRRFADTIMPMEGEISIHGLKTPVTIRRNDMG